MGYGYYEIRRPDQLRSDKPMKRGYAVSCKCHKRGCAEKIDRGLTYLCYYCTWYFCGKHLKTAWNPDPELDEEIRVECFAGDGSQVCEKCDRELTFSSDYYQNQPL